MIYIIFLILTLGIYGNTYQIKEPDALKELQQHINNIDYIKIRSDLDRKFRSYKPKDWKYLPSAKKSYTYYVDMKYTLDTDIPEINDKGEITGILYPKGFQFNPLDYMPYDPTPLVVFNGDNKKEKEWVKRNYKDKNVMLLVTRGNFAKISEYMGRPVYYLKNIIAEKLKLSNTVSVVFKENNRMRVDVYAVTVDREH